MGITPIACTRFCEQPDIPHVGGTKNPDVDAIVELRPDVVLVDREENRREDAEALEAAGLNLIVTHITAVGDVGPMLDDLCDRLGGRRLANDVDSVRPLDPPIEAFVPIWRRPWMTISAATYGSSLLAAIGVVNVYADHRDPYPTITLDDVARRRPSVVLLPSEPYDFTSTHIDEISASLPEAAVVRIDGQDLFWWGARTGAAIRRLHRAVRQIDGPSAP